MPFDKTLILGYISGIFMLLSGLIVFLVRKKTNFTSIWVPTLFAISLSFFFDSYYWKIIFFGSPAIHENWLERLLPSLPLYFSGFFGMIFLFRWIKENRKKPETAFRFPLSVSAFFGLQIGLAHELLNELRLDYSVSRILHGALYLFLIYLYFNQGPVRDYLTAAKHGLVISVFSTLTWLIPFYVLSGPDQFALGYINWLYIIFLNQGIAILFPLLIMYLLKPVANEQHDERENNLFQ